MTTTIDKVKEFHLAFGQPVRDVPTLPSYEKRLLRIKLAAEELAELAEALGVPVKLMVWNTARKWDVYDSETCPGMDADLIAAADALADIAYVNAGTALVCGIPLNACVAEVHRSNMSKLGTDGKPVLREDGKVMKGPFYTPPDLGPILARPQYLDTREYRAAMLSRILSEYFIWDDLPQGHEFWETAVGHWNEIAGNVEAEGPIEVPSGPQLAEMLVHAFPWHDSPQGEGYWADVTEALSELP